MVTIDGLKWSHHSFLNRIENLTMKWCFWYFWTTSLASHNHLTTGEFALSFPVSYSVVDQTYSIISYSYLIREIEMARTRTLYHFLHTRTSFAQINEDRWVLSSLPDKSDKNNWMHESENVKGNLAIYEYQCCIYSANRAEDTFLQSSNRNDCSVANVDSLLIICDVNPIIQNSDSE